MKNPLENKIRSRYGWEREFEDMGDGLKKWREEIVEVWSDCTREFDELCVGFTRFIDQDLLKGVRVAREEFGLIKRKNVDVRVRDNYARMGETRYSMTEQVVRSFHSRAVEVDPLMEKAPTVGVPQEETLQQKVARLEEELAGLRAGKPVSRQRFLKIVGLISVGTILGGYVGGKVSKEKGQLPEDVSAAAFTGEPREIPKMEIIQVAEKSQHRLISGLSGEELTDYQRDEQETDGKNLKEALDNWEQETIQLWVKSAEVIKKIRQGELTALTSLQAEEIQIAELRSELHMDLLKFAEAEGGFTEDQLDSDEAKLHMAKTLHWWRLQYTEMPFAERMEQAGFHLSGGAFPPAEAEVWPAAEGEFETQAVQPKPVILNPADLNIGERLSHITAINNNGLLALTGHTLDPQNAEYRASLRMQRKDGSWVTVTMPVQSGISHYFDPTEASYQVGPDGKRYIVMACCARPPANPNGVNVAHGEYQVIDGDTGGVVKQRTRFVDGNVGLKFFDYTVGSQFPQHNEVFFSGTSFGPAGNGPSEKIELYRFNKQTMQPELISAQVNSMGGAQFSQVVDYNPNTKKATVVFTEWGRKVWATEVYVEDIGSHKKGERGNSFVLLDFDNNEFTHDEVPENVFRDSSLARIVKLKSGDLMTAVEVDYINSQGQKKSRIKLEIRNAQGVQIREQYMPQSEDVNSVFASIVEINENMVLLETNKGKDSSNMAADATLLIKDPQLGWKGPLLEVTATNIQTADGPQSFARQYMGDISWGVLIGNKVYRFTYQQGGDVGQGTEVKFVVFDPDNDIYLPFISKGISMRVPHDHPKLEEYRKVVQAYPDKWGIEKQEDGGLIIQGMG